MIHAYSAPTPNGHKLHIMLEECEVDYELHRINFGDKDQFKPDFLKISPNNKIPAILDEDGPGGEPVSVFESGTILIYLAEKLGKFIPDAQKDPPARVFSAALRCSTKASKIQVHKPPSDREY